MRILFLALAALCLAGCVALPASKEPHPPIANLALPAVPAPAAAVDAWPENNWWKAYSDPQLDTLIARALADNPTLAVASARMSQAIAVADIASSNATLRISADLSAEYGRQSENYVMPKPPLGPGGQYVSQGQAAINLNHDLDLWGRNATLIRSARNQADAAAFDLAAARLALSTSIAHTYAQLASQYELLDIAEATLRQRVAIAELTQKRVAAGLDTHIEIRQAETGTATLRSEQVQLQTAISITALQLTALSGAMPDAAAKITRPQLQTPPFNLPASLPLDLLGRRPEIAAQRARISAATEEVQASKEQFYPNVNLAAMIGFQAFGLGHLFSAGSLTNSIGPAVHLPIFDGGRLRANYALKVAEQEGAIAQYNQSVLAAAQDVIEQLTRSSALEHEAAATGDALSAAQEAYRISMLRYREGLSPYLTVLAVESQLLTQRRAMADLKARRLDLQIALVRALGGGFVVTPAAQDNLTSEKP